MSQQKSSHGCTSVISSKLRSPRERSISTTICRSVVPVFEYVARNTSDGSGAKASALDIDASEVA
eukprot:2100821-Prymnesium_polylepis.1